MMENNNLKQGVSPSANEIQAQRNEQSGPCDTSNNGVSSTYTHARNDAGPDYIHFPSAEMPLLPITNADIAGMPQFLFDQIPETSFNWTTHVSQFNSSSNPNVDLGSFGRNELPQPHLDGNSVPVCSTMISSHVMPRIGGNIVSGQPAEARQVIWQGGVNGNNIVRTPSRRIPPGSALHHTPTGGEIDTNNNFMFDAFRPNYPNNCDVSFLTQGFGDINRRLRNLDVVGRDIASASNSAPLPHLHSYSSQNTRRSSNNHAPNVAGSSFSLQDNLRGFPFLPQNVGDWTYPDNSLSSSLSFSPASVSQQTQFDRRHHFPAERNMNISPAFGGNTNARTVNPQRTFQTYQDPNFPIARNSIESSMVSPCIGARRNIAEQNRLGSVSQFVGPRQPIRDLRYTSNTVGMGSVTLQASNHIQEPSFKRAAIQLPHPVPQALHKRRAFQHPIYSSLPPSGQTAPSLMSLPQSPSPPLVAIPQIRSHNSNSAQSLAQTPLPRLAHSGPLLRTPTNRVPSCSPQTWSSPSAPPVSNNVQFTPSLPQSSSDLRLKCIVSDQTQPMGHKCFLCKRDLTFTPEGHVFQPIAPPVAAVLPCGHVFHDLCLERITPADQAKEPPCIPCVLGDN